MQPNNPILVEEIAHQINEYEFLDLTDATEEDIMLLQHLLFGRKYENAKLRGGCREMESELNSEVAEYPQPAATLQNMQFSPSHHLPSQWNILPYPPNQIVYNHYGQWYPHPQQKHYDEQPKWFPHPQQKDCYEQANLYSHPQHKHNYKEPRRYPRSQQKHYYEQPQVCYSIVYCCYRPDCPIPTVD